MTDFEADAKLKFQTLALRRAMPSGGFELAPIVAPSIAAYGTEGHTAMELQLALYRVLFDPPPPAAMAGDVERCDREAFTPSPAGTSLADRIRRQPLSVVLFDEIEKADAAAFDRQPHDNGNIGVQIAASADG